jgi:hypothetical protein
MRMVVTHIYSTSIMHIVIICLLSDYFSLAHFMCLTCVSGKILLKIFNQNSFISLFIEFLQLSDSLLEVKSSLKHK